MLKSFLFAATVVLLSNAQASQTCGIMGENPNQPGTYDILIDYKVLDLSKKVYQFKGVGYWAHFSLKNGTFQVATTSQSETHKIFALALAKTNSITMIDGQNKINVYCFEK